MPELPDIVILARSMDQALRDRSIAEVAIHQPKCINRPEEEFCQAVVGRTFRRAWQRGKWALADLDRDWTLAFNLGMGGEVRLHGADEVPDPGRERVVFRLADGEQLWAHFWWFGHVHLVPLGDLSAHPQMARLGLEPLADDFTPQRLEQMLRGRRGAIKKYLLDQSFIAGIGNVYVQDILWHARLHPLRPANTLAPMEACTHCGVCVERCLFGARAWQDGQMSYDATACYGCGLCVTVCPADATVMQRRE